MKQSAGAARGMASRLRLEATHVPFDMAAHDRAAGTLAQLLVSAARVLESIAEDAMSVDAADGDAALAERRRILRAIQATMDELADDK